jgi:hypothetical protein
MSYYSLVSGLLAGVFFLSGLMKWLQPDQFATFSYELTGREASHHLARAVAAAEVVVGLLLFWPIGLVGACGAFLAATLFVGAALAAMRRGVTSCGCFGALDSSTPHWFTLARALGVAAIAGGCVWLSLTHDGGPTNRPFILAVGVLTGVAAGVGMTILGEIAGLRSQFAIMFAAERSAQVAAGNGM